MRYNNIGDAIAGAIDQARRGMTNHEYDLHIRRIKRYADKVEECEDALTVFDESETETAQYIKWATMLTKYREKLDAEINKGL
jgi:hypothetical protein